MTSPQLKNINEFPSVIQPAVSQFAQQLIEKFGDNIKAVLVYGSAVGVNYNPGVSNVNMAVIVKDFDFALLKRASVLVQKARKHKIAVPLFLTQEYVLNSLDVFPIEFMEIKDQHKIIFGEDFFAGLEIPLKDLRLLCEQQIKGKLLHLRQAYLDLGSNPIVLKNFLVRTFSDLIPVFRRLIDLKGQKALVHKEGMLKQLAKIFILDENALLLVYRDRKKKFLISSSQVDSQFQNFLIQLEVLSRHMDSL